MEITVDTITSLIKKIYQSISSLDTSSLLGLILAIGFITLVVGLIRESILNANTIIMSLFIGTIVYIYMKNSFDKKLKDLKFKNRQLQTDSILDDLCMGDEVRDRQTCNQYQQAKTNFYQLTNTLIQKYNWTK
jgi:uncharacterized membrane protein